MTKKPAKSAPVKKPKSNPPGEVLSDDDVQDIIEKLEAGEIELEQFEGQFEQLPHTQQHQITVSMARTLRYQGPLPLASELNGYEQVLPGAADRIIKMAENEQAHRQAHDDRAQSYYFRDRMVGFTAGFVLVVAMVASAIYCIAIGMAKWSLLFMGASVLAVIAKFLPGRHFKDGNKSG